MGLDHQVGLYNYSWTGVARTLAEESGLVPSLYSLAECFMTSAHANLNRTCLAKTTGSQLVARSRADQTQAVLLEQL